MPSSTRTIETDVCVVGAGLLGLAHALEARRRGLSVVLLDRGLRATGASVRHSGHLFFSALGAGALDAAPVARDRWLELSRRAGTATEEGGTLIIARRDEELAVMEAAAADPARGARMRSSKKLGKLAPIPLHGVRGAFHGTRDLRIAPRSAAVALAKMLARDASARVEWGTHVHAVEPGVVHAGGLRVRAEAIVICPGADPRLLPAELRQQPGGPVTRQTQMLRLAAPTGRRYRYTLATGLTLLDHAGFREQEEIEQLRARLELETPELVELGVSLVVTQLAAGELIVGGAATRADSPTPYSRERLDQLLLAQTEALLGISPTVRQRWRAAHLGLPDNREDFLTTRPMRGVRLVRAIRSTAASVCHTHAELVLDHLLAESSASSEYIIVHDRRKASPPAGGVREHAAIFGSRPAATR